MNRRHSLILASDTPLALLVPGDQKPSRAVHGVAAIHVVDLAR